MPSRREFLDQSGHSCTAALAAAALPAVAAWPLRQSREPPQNPTRANFPFAWANALKDAGHEVRIEVAGDATVRAQRPVGSEKPISRKERRVHQSEGDRGDHELGHEDSRGLMPRVPSWPKRSLS
jgi:hypothetical protein